MLQLGVTERVDKLLDEVDEKEAGAEEDLGHGGAAKVHAGLGQRLANLQGNKCEIYIFKNCLLYSFATLCKLMLFMISKKVKIKN